MEKYVEGGLSAETQIATFQIDKELFGIGIHKIKEIVRYPVITQVPRSLNYLKGLTNLRGNVLPVIDARVRLDLHVSDVTEKTRVLVLDLNDSLIGLIVDTVKGVVSLEDMRVETPPPILSSGVDSKFIKNVIHSQSNEQITLELNVDVLCDLCVDEEVSSKENVSFLHTEKEDKINSIQENQLVTFLIGYEEYGFSIQAVKEILRVSKITEIPDTPNYVLGVLSVRNNLLPIIDLRSLYGMNSLEQAKSAGIKKLIHSYKTWLDHFTVYLGNDSIPFKNPDAIEVMNWVESFRTSSEKIGKILQSIRYLHQEIIFHSRQSKNSTLFPTVEERNDHYLKLMNQFITQMIGYFEECNESLSLELKEDQRILVIDLNKQSIGIMVDRMQQVIRVPESIIDPPPAILQSEKRESLQGIVKLNEGSRLILLVDEKKLFSEQIFGKIKSMESIKSTSEEINSKEGKEMEQDEIQVVTFKLGREEFGLFISDVREINRITEITVVPNAPSFVEGIMNLRGNVIPAIDLRKRFQLEILKRNDSSRVIIVDIANKTTGFIVDSVSDVIRISKSSIEPPPDIISSNIQTEFVQGIANLTKQGRFIILLNVNRILNGDEKEQLKAS